MSTRFQSSRHMRLLMTVLWFHLPFSTAILGSAACVDGVLFHPLITQPPGALSLSEDVTMHICCLAHSSIPPGFKCSPLRPISWELVTYHRLTHTCSCDLAVNNPFPAKRMCTGRGWCNSMFQEQPSNNQKHSLWELCYADFISRG